MINYKFRVILNVLWRHYNIMLLIDDVTYQLVLF